MDKVAELQSQIAATQKERKRAEQLTSTYDGQVKKLQELHCQCQEEAGKMKALLETKEAELSRMLTALQISAAQVCVCMYVSHGQKKSCSNTDYVVQGRQFEKYRTRRFDMNYSYSVQYNDLLSSM